MAVSLREYPVITGKYAERFLKRSERNKKMIQMIMVAKYNTQNCDILKKYE